MKKLLVMIISITCFSYIISTESVSISVLQAQLVNYLKNRDYEGVCCLLTKNKFNLDFYFQKTKRSRCTPLMQACDQGDLDIVKLLLDYKVNIESYDHNNYTALVYASKSGHSEIVKELLKRGAHVNQRDGQSFALLKACKKNHFKVAKLLIKAGANLQSHYNKMAKTPLMEAANKGYISIVQELIQSKADVNYSTILNTTALHYATYQGHVLIAECLIKSDANVNVKDTTGYAPLHNIACYSNEPHFVTVIMKAKADINCVENSLNQTPLMIAIQKSHNKIVKELLLYKPNCNIQDKNGKTALHYAVESNNIDVIKMLIKNGADLDIKDETESTPLLYAMKHDNIEIIWNLLQAGASIYNEDMTITLLGYSNNNKDQENKYSRSILMLLLSEGLPLDFETDNIFINAFKNIEYDLNYATRPTDLDHPLDKYKYSSDFYELQCTLCKRLIIFKHNNRMSHFFACYPKLYKKVISYSQKPAIEKMQVLYAQGLLRQGKFKRLRSVIKDDPKIFESIIEDPELAKSYAQLEYYKKYKKTALALQSLIREKNLPSIKDEICSICLSNNTNYQLRCGHRFHYDCIKPWLTLHKKCSNCRFNFLNDSEFS